LVREQPFAEDCAIRGSLSGRADSDAELLQRFVTGRNEAAFAALMARHGPMVLGVCRRLLRHAQDSEDAFQATFLILVRKAASIGKRELLSNWLYGVALRVAARARSMSAQRRTHEAMDREQMAVATREPTGATDLSASVAEEVQRLPNKYRLPVVLYYLEGHTQAEVANTMRCPVGTIKTRLSRAREMLRRRLTRRGLALSTAAVATALLSETRAMSVPPTLLASTHKVAMAFAAGDTAGSGLISAQTAALTKEVLHNMFVAKMKPVVLAVLALALVLGGASALAYSTLANQGEKNEKTKPDKETIQGNWEVVSLERDGGSRREEEQLKSAVWGFDKGKLAWNLEGGDKIEADYKLDPTKSPKTIDLIIGGDPKRHLEGIYQLKGDELSICIPVGVDRPRPTELTGEKGSKCCLVVLKRKK
jgi:RNA polymerase sigma factor (sigma-70 family)